MTQKTNSLFHISNLSIITVLIFARHLVFEFKFITIFFDFMAVAGLFASQSGISSINQIMNHRVSILLILLTFSLSPLLSSNAHLWIVVQNLFIIPAFLVMYFSSQSILSISALIGAFVAFTFIQSRHFELAIGPWYFTYYVFLSFGVMGILHNFGSDILKRNAQIKDELQSKITMLKQILKTHFQIMATKQVNQSLQELQHEINNPNSILKLKLELLVKQGKVLSASAQQILNNINLIKSKLEMLPDIQDNKISELAADEVVSDIKRMESAIEGRWTSIAVGFAYLFAFLASVNILVFNVISDHVDVIKILHYGVFVIILVAGFAWLVLTKKFKRPLILLLSVGMAHLLIRSYIDGGLLSNAMIWVIVLPFTVAIVTGRSYQKMITAISTSSMIMITFFPVTTTEYFFRLDARWINFLMCFGMISLVPYATARRTERVRLLFKEVNQLENQFVDAVGKKQLQTNLDIITQILESDVLPLAKENQKLINQIGIDQNEALLIKLSQTNSRVLEYVNRYLAPLAPDIPKIHFTRRV